MNLWATNIANLWAIASRISKNKQLAIIDWMFVSMQEQVV
jgi:hypothetical protein